MFLTASDNINFFMILTCEDRLRLECLVPIYSGQSRAYYRSSYLFPSGHFLTDREIFNQQTLITMQCFVGSKRVFQHHLKIFGLSRDINYPGHQNDKKLLYNEWLGALPDNLTKWDPVYLIVTKS